MVAIVTTCVLSEGCTEEEERIEHEACNSVFGSASNIQYTLFPVGLMLTVKKQNGQSHGPIHP